MVDLMVRERQAEAALKGVPAGFKLTEVGVIPEDWDVKTIGQLNPFITSGSRGWADFYVDYGDLFVRITNMSRNSIYLDTRTCENKFVSLPVTSTEGKRTHLNNGDVLISITADIGIIGYIDESIAKPAYINQHISLVRFDDNAIDNKFVAYFLASENVQKKFLANSDLGAKAGMNLNGVRSIIFAVPTKKEQSAIAKALTDVDALIVELKKILTKKQAIKAATMQQLLTGKTRLPQFALREDGAVKGYKKSELGEIPEDWELVTFGSLTEKIIGGGTPSRNNPSFWGYEIPWVTVKDFTTFNPDLTQEYITRLGLNNSASNLIPKGTLITSTRMALGKAVIYEIDVAINQDIKAIFPTKYLNSIFLYFWFEHNAKKIDELGSGSTVKGLSLSDLRGIIFLLPSLEEQTAIAAILSDMDKDIQALQQRLDKTRQLKQGMMQELLTGKTRLI